MSNVGSEYSYKTLAQVAGCKSDRTVRKYLRFLEEAFLVFSIDRFSYKFREQAAFNKKAYAIDNGLITAVAFSMTPGTGRLAENAVAIALKKMQLQGKLAAFFWKSSRHEEVDFIVVKDRKVVQCIQVCWNLDRPNTLDREIRGLLKAGKELNCSDLLILTEEKEGEETATWFGTTGKIRFEKLERWLRERED